MKNLVVLLEPSEDAWSTPLKAGILMLNRLCIDEDAAFEISGVYMLSESSFENCKYDRNYRSREILDHIKTFKEMDDKYKIYAVLRREYDRKSESIHIIYAGDYYNHYYSHTHQTLLKSLILEGMKRSKLKSVILTMTYMWRWELITKDKMEDYCLGIDPELTESVSDNLECFFENLILGKEILREQNLTHLTYHLQKLTEKELELVAQEDPDYVKTFLYSANRNRGETNLPKTKSEFVLVRCRRKTITIQNSIPATIRNISCRLL